MTELQIKMLEILEDTKNFYSSDPTKRGKPDDGIGCFYEAPNGNKCAVGRHLSKEELAMVRNLEKSIVPSGIKSIWNLITTPKIKELPLEFWDNLQDFHDSDSYWGKSGLTNMGNCKYHQIKQMIEIYTT